MKKREPFFELETVVNNLLKQNTNLNEAEAWKAVVNNLLKQNTNLNEAEAWKAIAKILWDPMDRALQEEVEKTLGKG